MREADYVLSAAGILLVLCAFLVADGWAPVMAGAGVFVASMAGWKRPR